MQFIWRNVIVVPTNKCWWGFFVFFSPPIKTMFYKRTTWVENVSRELFIIGSNCFLTNCFFFFNTGWFAEYDYLSHLLSTVKYHLILFQFKVSHCMDHWLNNRWLYLDSQEPCAPFQMSPSKIIIMKKWLTYRYIVLDKTIINIKYGQIFDIPFLNSVCILKNGKFYLQFSSVAQFFSSHLQSFPASGSFQMSLFFTSGGQSTGISGFSISPSNEYSGLISFRMVWLYLLVVQGILKSLLQHHSSKASILWCSAFFIVQLSHPFMTIGKTIALTIHTFVGKVISLLFNMLFRFVIAFLPRSKCLLISWLQSPFAVILEPKKTIDNIQLVNAWFFSWVQNR